MAGECPRCDGEGEYRDREEHRVCGRCLGTGLASIERGGFYMLATGDVVELSGRLNGRLHLSPVDRPGVRDVSKRRFASHVRDGEIQRVEQDWALADDAAAG